MPRTLPWSLMQVSDAEASRRRVMYGLRSYVRARADVARMEVADLPVLPHQEIALAHAVELLEQEGDGLAMAAAAVLTEQPAMLTGGASGETDVLMALLAATEAHRDQERDAERMTRIVTKPRVFPSALRGSGPARPRAFSECPAGCGGVGEAPACWRGEGGDGGFWFRAVVCRARDRYAKRGDAFFTRLRSSWRAALPAYED